MESGTDHRLTSGWLNRVAARLKLPPGTEPALSVGNAVPMLLRGPAQVGSWLPEGGLHPDAGLYAKLAALYQGDALTGPALIAGLRERGFTEAVLVGTEQGPNRFSFGALTAAAGRMLAAPQGPRLAALEIGGWDTHDGQVGRLNGVLKQLDEGLAGLKTGLGEAWKQTAVLLMTEFGRTVRVNGTKGTDHGTGTVAFVLGGGVAGGRVQADWPGLGQGKLFENRDLQPSADLRSVAKGLLAQHLGLDDAAQDFIFPGSRSASPMRGLLRA
jgi:uncharacterized protein (DUF1501 family)